MSLPVFSAKIYRFFARIEFEKTVEKTKADNKAEGFTCWGQFVSMGEQKKLGAKR
ncbi:MAG TPA: hypothetical protein DCP92_14200 [Nitrospiraceae bacterium]|nr:hypothetical protein [Nitrospiraceae bacterium]